jgi:taurine dioxygenase
MTSAAGRITVDRVTSVIGGEVRGVDLSEELDEATVAVLHQALLDHLVLFFRHQTMTTDDHIRLARAFGEIDLPLFRTTSSPRPEVIVLDQVAPKGQGADSWHADNTYMECPPMGSILRAVELPGVGGDTCFASMYAAYEALSPALQAVLDGLGAVHCLEQMVERTKHVANASLRDSLDQWPPVVHPVVRVHPETGRKLLNVNANWTVSIDGFSKAESDALLGFLLSHLKSPEFQCRFHWSEGAVAFWDNRAVQHYASSDYWPQRRTMERASIVGVRPARER